MIAATGKNGANGFNFMVGNFRMKERSMLMLKMSEAILDKACITHAPLTDVIFHSNARKKKNN